MTEASNEMLTVGVLGGMGPAATVEFFRRIIERTPAHRDQDHLHLLIDNDPRVPDRTAALLCGGEDPAPRLIGMARTLQGAGAEILAMPCNTAHAYIDRIREAVSIPVLDMIAETISRIRVQAIGLLATAGTVHIGLYQRMCDKSGIEIVPLLSEEQEQITRAIYGIKAGEAREAVESTVRGVVTALGERGAQQVIAGCTEISLVDGTRMPLPWLDALECLVEATIRRARRCSEKGDAVE